MVRSRNELSQLLISKVYIALLGHRRKVGKCPEALYTLKCSSTHIRRANSHDGRCIVHVPFNTLCLFCINQTARGFIIFTYRTRLGEDF